MDTAAGSSPLEAKTPFLFTSCSHARWRWEAVVSLEGFPFIQLQLGSVNWSYHNYLIEVAIITGDEMRSVVSSRGIMVNQTLTPLL